MVDWRRILGVNDWRNDRMFAIASVVITFFFMMLGTIGVALNPTCEGCGRWETTLLGAIVFATIGVSGPSRSKRGALLFMAGGLVLWADLTSGDVNHIVAFSVTPLYAGAGIVHYLQKPSSHQTK